MNRFYRTIIFLILLAIVFTIGVFTILAVNNRGSAPVAYWKFDEGAGPTAYDSAGANDGTITNALWRNEPDCKMGKCLYFDGNGDYVSVTDFTETGSSGQLLSVFYWVKASTQNYIGILGHFDQALNQMGWFTSTQSTTDKFRVLLSDNGSTIQKNYYTSISVFNNTWHYVGFTWNNGTLKLYVDGVEDTSVTKTTDNAMTAIYNPTVNLILGGQFHNGVLLNSITGHIDSPKIYNYARTAAQIKADYLGGAAGRGAAIVGTSRDLSLQQSQGLLGHYKMDETSWTNNCSTATVLDASGNSKTGKACPATTGPTGGAAGKFGNAGSFDGIDDYVEILDIDF